MASGCLIGVPQKSALKKHGRNVNKMNLFYYKQYALQLSLVTSVATTTTTTTIEEPSLGRPKGGRHLIGVAARGGGRGGLLPYMSNIGMCRCEGYGFQRVYSRIGYRNQRVLV